MSYIIAKEFGSFDNDMSGEIDIEEARRFCENAMEERFPGREFDDELFNDGFHKIDRDHSGSIAFIELLRVI